ncbi:MAG: hypothetical protein K2H98_01330, partial [Duncaniella sp.]|nr:hypothetical protein [Duncaniella sp.]
CGIIKVEYHDYNCFHLIFVRQGYHKGVQLGNATWSCYNVYATSRGGTNPDLTNNAPSPTETNVPVALTKSPLSVGSLLKRNQYNYSIKEENVKDGYGWLKDITGVSLKTSYIKSDKTVGEHTATWAEIQGYGWTNYQFGTSATAERFTYHWADTWTACGGFRDNETFAVPTAADFQSLLDNAKFGYGIVYADGANTTFKKFDDACGFMDCDNNGIDDEPSAEGSRGVRACIAYEDTYGKNVIFPLGAIGQARRNKNGPTAGTLSYGGLAGLLSSALYRPYTYNLYRETGSIYWIYQPVTISGTSDGNLGKPWADYASWDINYYVLRFFAYDSDGSLGGWDKKNKKYSNSGVNSTNASDALPIKLIYQ